MAADENATLARLGRAALAVLKEFMPGDSGFRITGVQFEKDDVSVSKPFAGFADFDACVTAQTNKGHSAASARKICGAIQAETEKAERVAAEEDAKIETVTKSVKIWKSTTEERYVLGIVLEPTKEMGEADSQGDVYSAEEIRQAAYRFMEKSQTMGIQHKEAAGDRIKVLESWIAREDATIEGQPVVAGTWLLGARIVDDELWEAVKNGDFTGWSIGGVANRTPLDETTEE